METNDEKELEGFLSETPSASEEEVEEREIEEEEKPQEVGEDEEEEETEGDEPEDVEEVSALTAREQALIAQFTESPDSAEAEEYDPSKPPEAVWEAQSYQFLKEGENIDDILADPAKFNAKMQEFYNAALQRGAQMALEATYRSLPRTITTYAKQQIETVNLVNDFYNRNKDLVPLKPALARIAQKIGTEHPEYTLTQLLSESAKTARTIFKVPKKQQAVSTKTPAFVGQKGGANRVSSKRSTGTNTLEEQVMDLIS
jgi:hypothetical protein